MRDRFVAHIMDCQVARELHPAREPFKIAHQAEDVIADVPHSLHNGCAQGLPDRRRHS